MMDHHARSEAIGFFNHCASDFLLDFKICTIFCVLCLSTILFVNPFLITAYQIICVKEFNNIIVFKSLIQMESVLVLWT